MNRLKGSTFAFLSTSIFAVNFVSMKVLVDYFPTMLLIALRFLIASGFLFVLGKKIKLSFKIKNVEDIKMLILTGFLGMSFYYIFFTFALKFISAPLTSLLCSTIPIITIFIYSFIKKTPIDYTLVIAFIISIFGVYMAIDLDVITNNLTGLFIGVSLMIIGILGWIYYTIKVEDLMKSYDTLVVLTYQSLAGGLINLSLSLFQFNQVIKFTQNRIPIEVIGHLLFVSLFGSALGYYLFI